MINLKIDPEFQNQIPPLTDDEYKQLEENILKEGKLLSPLIVWNNTLVDGHNRYAILQKHPEICFSTMPLRFESREEVLAWICKNQLGRRNLSPEQKRYLIGKQYEAEKKAAKIFRGNQYTLAKKSGGAHDDNHHSGKKTCDRIAEENGVSRASVLRASHYTRGIDIADTLSPGIKQKVFSGEVKFTNEEMSKLVQASAEHRLDVLAQILHPEALEVLESASAEFEPEKAEPVSMPTPQTEEFRCYHVPPKRFDFVSECLKLCQYRSTKSLILSAPEFAFEIVTPCRIRYNTGTIWTQAYNEMPAVSSFCAYFGRCQREGEQDHGKKRLRSICR